MCHNLGVGKRKGAGSIEDKQSAAEAAYLAGEMTLKQLAAQMEMPVSTICRWSKAGKWKEKREKIKKRAIKKTATKIVSKKCRELEKILKASGSLENALIMAAAQFEAALKAVEKDKGANGKGLVADGFRAKNLQSLAGAIQTAANTRMLISGMMTAAEKEKLQIEREKLEMEKRKEAAALEEESSGGDMTVSFDMPVESDISLEDLMK